MYLCCGDSLFDLFVGEGATSGGVGDITLSGGIGGSPLNVASGLARLGHDSRYFTGLSTDLFGQRQRLWLTREGIDASLSIQTARNTTLAVVELDDTGAAQYAFYKDGTADTSLVMADLPASLPDAIRVLHFASYCTTVLPTSKTFEAFAIREAGRRLISYDPNLRLTVEPDIERWRETFGVFANTAAFVKASDEDIEGLFGPRGEDRFVTDCFERGVQLVCITRGPNGASAFARDGDATHSPGRPVDVIDTVGAGDTFQATVLHWLGAHGHVGDSATLQGRIDIESMLALALKAAAITCSRRGADLPRLTDLDA